MGIVKIIIVSAAIVYGTFTAAIAVKYWSLFYGCDNNANRGNNHTSSRPKDCRLIKLGQCLPVRIRS